MSKSIHKWLTSESIYTIYLSQVLMIYVWKIQVNYKCQSEVTNYQLSFLSEIIIDQIRYHPILDGPQL